uniref:Uncharacterized protein n=1 Tax=Anguilla anguilla TaxID=7936 RepID=A0A0E9RN39_ANGAN
MGPLVQVDGLDPGDVHAQVAVDSSTADADEYSQIPGSPSRTFGLTISAEFIFLLRKGER